MLDINRATKVVRKNLPNGKIQKTVVYENLYLFQVFFDDPGEGEYDPFYSVNRVNREFKEFSILTDGDLDVISSLFTKTAKQQGNLL